MKVWHPGSCLRRVRTATASKTSKGPPFPPNFLIPDASYINNGTPTHAPKQLRRKSHLTAFRTPVWFFYCYSFAASFLLFLIVWSYFLSIHPTRRQVSDTPHFILPCLIRSWMPSAALDPTPSTPPASLSEFPSRLLLGPLIFSSLAPQGWGPPIPWMGWWVGWWVPAPPPWGGGGG